MNQEEELKWFCMRSTYGREMKVRETLDGLSIENYIPMTYQTVETKGERRRQLVPAVRNLIFIHSTKKSMDGLKSGNPLFSSLRYMMRRSVLDSNLRAEIITVPTRQMDNFISATKGHEDDVTYLKENNRIFTEGQKVRITAGAFSGVEGHVKRIQKNKRVLVSIEGISCVMLNFVPSALIELLSENNKPK